ncbi:MAG TPA: glycosyltransferase family 9 protein [Geobacteraceae bacterium]|nr:glycosyltransferase family 9 protein [Geobacteraceae bacterium]
MTIKIRNILIIKPGAMGDLLQITPVLRSLRMKYPDARISILVGNTPSVDLFRHHPLVHDTIVFDRRGEHRSISALVGLWSRLRKGRYDLVLNYQRSNLKAWLLVSAALPCRTLVYQKARGRVVHAVINHLETIAPLGIDPLAADLRLEFVPGPEAGRYAEGLFAAAGLTGKTVIALNPGASFRIKCWPARRFALLGERLGKELGAGIVIVGGGGERDLADDICSGLTRQPLDLVGRTDLSQLGAVLRRCALLVSGDTGPMHMATAVGIPVVALFGAIDPARSGPVGEGHIIIRHPEISCVPCNAKSCSNPQSLICMEEISVDEVFRAVVAVLGRTKGSGG